MTAPVRVEDVGTGPPRRIAAGLATTVLAALVLVELHVYWVMGRMMTDLEARQLESVADNATVRAAQQQVVSTADRVTVIALVLVVVAPVLGSIAGRRRYWTYPLLVVVAAAVAIWLLNAHAVDVITSFDR